VVTRRPPEAGPPGVRRISTPQLQLARLVITDTADHGAVGVIHGVAGLGKTFAMKTCTAALAARTRPADRIEVVTIAFPSRPTMRLLADLLLQTLTGAPPHHATRPLAGCTFVDDAPAQLVEFLDEVVGRAVRGRHLRLTHGDRAELFDEAAIVRGRPQPQPSLYDAPVSRTARHGFDVRA